jgi:hypothetical protein
LLDGVGDRDVVGKFFAVSHAARNTPCMNAENRAMWRSSRKRIL